MNVHNLMEDIVKNTVEELFKDTTKVDPALSGCLQCKMDVVCYVLNRIKPEYIISGRGLIHFEDDYHKKIQLEADLIALAAEGIKKITEIKRPYYLSSEKKEIRQYPYFFNFPAIMGRVVNGKTFEPVYNTLISLYLDNKPARMIDTTWENPYLIVKSTRGSFSFMAEPFPSDTLGEKKEFSFELRISKEGFEPLNHFFTLEVISEKEMRTSYNIKWTYSTETLYLFQSEDEDESSS